MKPDPPVDLEAHGPVTRWQDIATARDASHPKSREAMAALILRYEPLLRSFFNSAFRHVHGQTEDDLVQGFLTDHFVTQRLLDAADPARGRFRSLLFTAFRNYILLQIRRDRKSPMSLDTVQASDLPAVSANENDYGLVAQEEVIWARFVLSELIRRARWDFQARGHLPMWEVLYRRLVAPAFEGVATPNHGSIAAELGLDGAKQSENLLKSAKRRLKQLLIELLAELGSRDEEIGEDVADLLKTYEAARTLFVEHE